MAIPAVAVVTAIPIPAVVSAMVVVVGLRRARSTEQRRSAGHGHNQCKSLEHHVSS
jgi:hypothetical protein